MPRSRTRKSKHKTCMTDEQRVALRSRLYQIESENLHEPTEGNAEWYVNEVMKRVVRPALKGSYSEELFTGSSYELSALSRTSDFDIQVFLKMPGVPGKRRNVKPDTGILEPCDRPGWRKIHGGPSSLLTNGYLSAKKVRREFQSKIDSFLAKKQHSLEFKVDRIESGPATTLFISTKADKFITTIDVVACVKGRHIHPKSNSVDLVAKPYNKQRPDDHEDCWRMSCSKREKKRFTKTYTNRPRVLTMLKILKLLKQSDPQFSEFPSYFYKNIMLKYLDSFGQVSRWDRESFDLRFEGLIKEICQALLRGELKVFYNHEENLLANVSPSSYQPLQFHLQSAIEKGTYIELLDVIT